MTVINLLQKGKKISLKKAAKTFLNLEIQKDKHSALEDAKTTMELYLLLKVRVTVGLTFSSSQLAQQFKTSGNFPETALQKLN